MAHERGACQTLGHEAMAAHFSVQVVHDQPQYARQAVAAAFELLDMLEAQLSRFVEGSDVWRINRLRPGETAVVALDTFRCLAQARELQQRTGGAFDVTYRSQPTSLATERLELELGRGAVRMLASGVEVDLGGIGKGYALDQMATLLAEWEVTTARLAASRSTTLALEPPPGEPGWLLTYGDADGLRRRHLSRSAFSGSGLRVKGLHIWDPHTGRVARRRERAWARARSAAQADALSTAFMVMSAEAVACYCRNACPAEHVQAFLLEEPGGELQALPLSALGKEGPKEVL